MPLLDWFRGRGAGRSREEEAASPESERVEARRHVQESAAAPEQTQTAESAVDRPPEDTPPRGPDV